MKDVHINRARRQPPFQVTAPFPSLNLSVHAHKTRLHINQVCAGITQPLFHDLFISKIHTVTQFSNCKDQGAALIYKFNNYEL